MEIIIANLFIAALSKLIPIIEAKAKTGEISVSEQAQVRADYLALREAGDRAFAGTEWSVSTQQIPQ